MVLLEPPPPVPPLLGPPVPVPPVTAPSSFSVSSCRLALRLLGVLGLLVRRLVFALLVVRHKLPYLRSGATGPLPAVTGI